MKRKIETSQMAISRSRPKSSKKSIHPPTPLSFNPKDLKSLKDSSQLKSSKNSQQKPLKKTHRRTVSENLCLVPLKGLHKIKAAKVYKNQIFTDVYDEHGNHDRILETTESIEVYQEVSKGSVLTFNNKSDISTEKFIQPYNSFNSLEVTSKCLKDELFEKLQKLVEKPKNVIEEIMRPVTLGRNKVTSGQNFFFH